jgi:hypothetical protein
MRRLVLTLAVAAALVSAAFGGQILWGTSPQPSASDGDSIVWGT